jgi:hypothetical protein
MCALLFASGVTLTGNTNNVHGVRYIKYFFLSKNIMLCCAVKNALKNFPE